MYIHATPTLPSGAVVAKKQQSPAAAAPCMPGANEVFLDRWWPMDPDLVRALLPLDMRATRPPLSISMPACVTNESCNEKLQHAEERFLTKFMWTALCVTVHQALAVVLVIGQYDALLCSAYLAATVDLPLLCDGSVPQMTST